MSSPMYFKSLFGDIISYPYINHPNLYSLVITKISNHMNCSNYQLIILGEDEKNAPELKEGECYNFIIRDPDYFRDNYIVSVDYFRDTTLIDENGKQKNYNEYIITIQRKDMENNSFNCHQKFSIYKSTHKHIFYHEKDIVKDDKDDKGNNKPYNKIKNNCKRNGFLYSIISENLNVIWYDKEHILERIMGQFDNIERVIDNYYNGI